MTAPPARTLSLTATATNALTITIVLVSMTTRASTFMSTRMFMMAFYETDQRDQYVRPRVRPRGLIRNEISSLALSHSAARCILARTA